MSSTNRRSFLARGAALAAVPTVAALATGVLTDQASADTLPNFAPIPKSALGPAVNADGYYVGRVEKNLYWVTDATYQAAFLTTKDGVVLFDAPPTIGHNLQRAIDKIASDNGRTLAAVDVYTASTAFVLLESIRLDLGAGSQVHA
jgi:hypothetical protein